MIFQSPTNPALVLAELSALVSDPTVRRLRTAVAYANERGVQALEGVLGATDSDFSVEVIVTLDMGITRKAALDRLLRDFRGATRTITTPPGFGTFHAKAFVTDRHNQPTRALVGSANLTDAAMTRNYEAISVADLSPRQTIQWDLWWEELLTGSKELNEQTIATYNERVPQRGARERIADEDVETGEDGSVLVHHPPAVDARDARWLVIDWGGTGEYRVQFECPKAAAAFFRPDRTAERHIIVRMDGRLYTDNQLTFYADNGMARINLDQAIPAVEDGSIKQKMSLFMRNGINEFDLRVVGESERAHRLVEARLVGGYGRTRRRDGTYREFGWV